MHKRVGKIQIESLFFYFKFLCLFICFVYLLFVFLDRILNLIISITILAKNWKKQFQIKYYELILSATFFSSIWYVLQRIYFYNLLDPDSQLEKKRKKTTNQKIKVKRSKSKDQNQKDNIITFSFYSFCTTAYTALGMFLDESHETERMMNMSSIQKV